MKKNKGLMWFYIILVAAVLMVNPPIVYLINGYCSAHPITLGWPTMFLWLEFWYTVMVVDFVVGALKLKAWNCSQDDKPIEQVKRG